MTERSTRKPAAAEVQDPIGALESRLGHVFSNRALIEEALTHASRADERKDRISNERLEFLGDRVLGLLAAEALVAAEPSAAEGYLAQRLNQLVRREQCALVAERLGIGGALVLSEAEARSGGRAKPALLADACEAVIAAVYLDAGLEAARAVFQAQWASAMGAGATRDAKSLLQEWTQERSLGLPLYEETGRAGADHQPTFLIEVRVSDTGSAEGRGPSKRAAEQAAAEALLRRLGAWPYGDGGQT